MQQARASMVSPGDVVAGRYRVEQLVGRGGFGAVFRAVHLAMNRTVALKIVLPQVASNEEVRARFRREAELAQRLEHPNTVRIYDFGMTDAGLLYIAWEFLNGQSLEDLIVKSGRQEAGRAARIGVQILKSLMEAHEKGIVHRDIKPSNIFLCDFSGEKDFVKVLDFGIAKAADVQQVTRGGSMIGTPAYMSPEQVSAARVTAASDIYALGLVLAEVLAGQPVYRGDAPLSIAMAQLSDEPPPLPEVAIASSLGPIIVRATHKSVERRFASAAEMLEALERVDPGWLRASDSRPISASAIASARKVSPSADIAFVSAETVGAAPTIGVTSTSSVPAWSVVPPTRDDPELASVPPTGASAEVGPPLQPLVPKVSRSWAALFGGGTVVAILASILLLAFCGQKTPISSSPTAPVARRSEPDFKSDRPPRFKRISALTPSDVKVRLERAGCRVTYEGHIDAVNEEVFTIACNGDIGQVILFHGTEQQAQGLEHNYAGFSNAIVLRDLSTLLIVEKLKNPRKVVEQFR